MSVLKRSASVQPWTIPPKFATMALHLTIRKPGFLIRSPGVKTLEELFLRRHQDPVPVKDNPRMSSQSTAIGGPLGGTPTLLSLAKPFAKPLEWRVSLTWWPLSSWTFSSHLNSIVSTFRYKHIIQSSVEWRFCFWAILGSSECYSKRSFLSESCRQASIFRILFLVKFMTGPHSSMLPARPASCSACPVGGNE